MSYRMLVASCYYFIQNDTKITKSQFCKYPGFIFGNLGFWDSKNFPNSKILRLTSFFCYFYMPVTWICDPTQIWCILEHFKKCRFSPFKGGRLNISWYSHTRMVFYLAVFSHPNSLKVVLKWSYSYLETFPWRSYLVPKNTPVPHRL